MERIRKQPQDNKFEVYPHTQKPKTKLINRDETEKVSFWIFYVFSQQFYIKIWQLFLKKWANSGLFFVYFRPFLMTISIRQIEKA